MVSLTSKYVFDTTRTIEKEKIIAVAPQLERILLLKDKMEAVKAFEPHFYAYPWAMEALDRFSTDKHSFFTRYTSHPSPLELPWV